ncbi:dihydrolipoyllysine-residue acetyltransferase [Idiomarina xiamenensis]|uniref:Acetyltransferase component of pyruvate dehydrogenase complex n=1 Tax=Idiomarina xiamenensis 10-D-4 TaxID=740709 RepID=K2L6A5_9GAMM|nr:dihydrolipoyllysine-residue acetyltransferase [Idiomarina xiamenensis]EKE85310.1 dihydrolipoamide acetyltransferase [Idiomarina xiamenensis 10-D-4]
MANAQEVKVPDVGGEEVEIIEVLIAEGDSIEAEDALITVESDKASMDIPAPFGGKVDSVKVKVGDKIKEGDLLALISAADDNGDDEADSDSTDEAETEQQQDTQQDEAKDTEADNESDSQQSEQSSSAKGESQVVEVKVPDIGDASDVEIIEVLVAAGDSVNKEDGLITLETDKATMDVPCPDDGEIVEMLVKAGDKVSEGSVIAKMKVTAGADESAAQDSKDNTEKQASSDTEERSDKAEKKAEQKPAQSTPTSERQPPVPDHSSQRSDRKDGVLHASPAVRRVAREFGVDLSQVSASGPKNRILKEDVQSYVKYELSRPKAAAGTMSGGAGGLQVIDQPKVDFSKFGEIEEVALSRIQKISGPNLHRNWVTIPHVTQFDEADITELENFRKAENEVAKKQDLGFKITPLVFIMKACAKALLEYPQFNSSLAPDGEHLIMKKYVHIGIAVDTPNGLVVPVLRDVDKKGIYELSKELLEVSARARDGKLKAADMQGGCFSISSLGGIGGTAFTPIVNAPEVAILGVSRSDMKPVWNGKEFVPRLTLPLSLSYDHRVIDGALAARFTSYLSQVLSDIRKLVL